MVAFAHWQHSGMLMVKFKVEHGCARVSTVLDRDRSNKPGMRTRTEVFWPQGPWSPPKNDFTSFWFIKWSNLMLY